jgi:hypothetical protein
MQFVTSNKLSLFALRLNVLKKQRKHKFIHVEQEFFFEYFLNEINNSLYEIGA